MPALKRESLLAAANGHLAVALREHIRTHAEERPGVYRMVGADGVVMYVGKSVRVRSRLLSYFRADRTEKATEIISAARQIEWEYVPSEFASLLLELRQIQKYRPPYNVQHKIEPGLCFIRVSREEAPRVHMTTQVSDDGAIYYGPYRGREMVRHVLREVADLLQLRDCAPATKIRFADQLDLFDFDATPKCVRADLQKCLAPCAARCTRLEYLARVEEARRFLEGNVHRPLRVLQDRMQQAALRMQFEYAALLRDRVQRLEGARAELVALRSSIESLSFLYTVPGQGGDHRVYVIHRGTIHADLPVPRTVQESERLQTVMRQTFRPNKRNLPATTRDAVAEVLLVSRWFRLRPAELTRTTMPSGQDTL